MGVQRIVANIATNDTAAAKRFYQDILELDVAMDMGWITTYTSAHSQTCQLSVATEGGSGTSVPDLSIEVDNIEQVYHRMQESEFDILYSLIKEPWGVRRFYVQDPFGKVINILQHTPD